MNTINQYNTSLYIPKTTKHNSLRTNSNVISFGNIRHLQPKNITPARGEVPAIKTKLADLFERISVAAFKLSERLLQKPSLTDSQRLLEQQETIRTLTKNLNRAKQEFETTLSAYEKGTINPALRRKIKEEVLQTELNYDIMAPYFETEKPLYSPDKYKYNYEEIPTVTNNRADMQELKIPEIALNGSFNFELPQGEMKIKRVEQKELKESFEIQSNISDKYSESLAWDTDKIVRDMLQNFFDGHGQTLDGVRFIFTPIGLGKYKVRIEGKSTYNYKEAVLLGESQSHNDNKAAGNYGEGLKMVTLKLLMQNKASDVKIGSGNWEVLCSMKKDDRLESNLMNYKISPAIQNYDGNYIEFETSGRKLLETIRIFINRFYHSSNQHFQTPNFENRLFGVKVLPDGEKGGLYINGQRFEYAGNYGGINEGVLFIKEKIPTECYDVSRDRVSITSSNFYSIASWLEKHTTSSEMMQLIKVLEPFMNDDHNPLNTLLDQMLFSLGYEIEHGKFGAIKFPDKYIARNVLFLDSDIMRSLWTNGYKIFPQGYVKLGMNSTSNILKKSKTHKALEPTNTERTKIVIIKRALNLLSRLKDVHFTEDELDAKIYIFDGKSKRENEINNYKYVYAEALINYQKQKSYGFWIDKTYLNKAKFAHILETALHELSHKAGGDGDEKFGYKLTNVNQEAILQIIQDPKIAQELRILNDIWEKL